MQCWMALCHSHNGLDDVHRVRCGCGHQARQQAGSQLCKQGPAPSMGACSEAWVATHIVLLECVLHPLI